MRNFLILLSGLLFLSCVEENPALEQQNSSHSELNGTIVCWSHVDGTEIYRSRVGGWRFTLHPDSAMNANTENGYVRITGGHVTYIDDNGNRIFLLNHPCQIILPEN